MTQIAINTISSAISDGAEAESRVISSLEELERLVPQWRRLQEECYAGRSPYSPKRVIAMMRAMGDRTKPHVLVQIKNGEVQSLLIARLDIRRIKCRIGYMYLPTPKLRCLNIVYGGLLAQDDHAMEAMIEHLRSELRSKRIEHVMISKAPVESPLFARLTAIRGSVVRERRLHWCADLVPGSYEATVERFERKDRYNRRKVRAIEKNLGAPELVTVTQADQIDEFVTSAASISAKSYQAALGAGFEDSPMWRSVLTELAHAEQLRCYLLRCGGVPVAYQVGSVNGRTFVLDAAAYDPAHRNLSPGTVLLILVIRDLCEHGFECLDYGFGDAPYKRQYGVRHWEECNVHLYGGGPRARVTRWIDAGGVGAAKLTKRLAGSDTAQRIRKAWRRKLEASE